MSASRTSRFAAWLPRARGRRIKTGAFVAAALFAGVTAGNMASGVTTITAPVPEQPGNVVRDESVSLSINPGANVHTRNIPLVAGSAWTNVSDPFTAGLLCTGDNPAGTNRSPRSTVVVTGPGGIEILNQVSPVKDRGLVSPTYGQPLVPQPPPGNSNYRGGPWTTSASLAGRPAGIYTVTTTIENKYKNGLLGACTTGSATIGSTSSTAVTNGPIIESFQFEYRPWQQQFNDFFGGGSVRFNITPEEFTYTVGGAAGPLVKGTAGASAMSFYALPDAASYALPADPASCAVDPSACIPDLAYPCDPGAGCTPRLVFINYSKFPTTLIGLFDLQTRAFVAFAQAGGKTRVLVSGGTQVDALLNTTFANVIAAAAAAGVDLPLLLAQPIVVKLSNGNGMTNEITLSLFEGLEIFTRPTVKGPPGPLTLGAGLIIHIATWTPTPDTLPTGYGYTVQEAGILPAIPSGLPAPANLLLSGGKIRHVVGRVPVGGGQHVIALSVDTAAGEPNGLPFWIPIVSGATTVADNGIEFIGDDVIIASAEGCPLGICFGFGALVGTGLALFPVSPLDGLISIGDIPALWNDCMLNTATVTCPTGPIALITQVDGILQDIAGQALANPTVAEALAALDPIIGPLLADVPIPEI